jgi:hypothetical protein
MAEYSSTVGDVPGSTPTYHTDLAGLTGLARLAKHIAFILDLPKLNYPIYLTLITTTSTDTSIID